MATRPASHPSEGELPFFVERDDYEDSKIIYRVWQRDAPVVRVHPPRKPVVFGEERLIASFDEIDFPRDAKRMADRVCLGLNMTTDMKEFG